jgi:hypothetical protein
MASPIAINYTDNIPNTEIYLSTARVYFAFIDFSGKELVCLEVGVRVHVTLLDYNKTA